MDAQAGLRLCCSLNPKTGFLRFRRLSHMHIHVLLYSRASDINFDQNLHLRLDFVCASSERPDETARGSIHVGQRENDGPVYL